MEVPNVGFASEGELPFIRNLLAALEMLRQSPLGIDQEVLERTEARIQEHVETVDNFYAALHIDNWVYHESMDGSTIRELILPAASLEEKRERLVQMYSEPKFLDQSVRRLLRNIEFVHRSHLLDEGLTDHAHGRYDSSVLKLLAVMDGAVSDARSDERGLHALEANDLVTWNSPVGLRLGLPNAHRTMKKGVRKLIVDECHELDRNGIVHGMIMRFDNPIVASKCLNRLFAVGDWMMDYKKSKNPKLWLDSPKTMISKAFDSQRGREAILSYFRGDSSQDARAELLQNTRELLLLWNRHRMDLMTAFLPSTLVPGKEVAPVGQVRKMMGNDFPLEFEIRELEMTSPLTAEVTISISFSDGARDVRLTWVGADSRARMVFNPEKIERWVLAKAHHLTPTDGGS